MADANVNDEIYKILGRGKPSDEDVAKNPALKADWDKAQQLIKDNWKDGVPDEFMAKAFPKYDTKVTLGYYDAKQAKKLANIVAGLKEFDENNPDDKMLDKFINADNTPNGNTPATYIASHAIAMQKMLDNDEHKNDEDKAKMQSFLQDQQETLQMLGDNGADFSKIDQNGQNVEKVAQIGQPKGKYSPALDQFIAKVHTDGEKYQDSVVVKEKLKAEEKLKALNVKEQGQTNIGNTQALAPNEQQKQQPQPELEGDVKPEDQEHGSGSEDYKGPAIKEKDIIDYLYNDVFIYYLNMLADKIIGYVKGKADRFAEYTRAESAKAQKSKSNLRSQQCDKARQKCVGLFQQTAPQLTAEMEQAQLGRAKKLKMLNSELRENIVNRRPIEQWAFPSMQQRQQQMQQQMQQMGADASDEQRTAAQAQYVAEVSADRHIVDHFKQLYTQDPENCMRQLELAEKNLDKYLELDNAITKIAINRVMIRLVDKGLEEKSPSFVNSKEWDFNNEETRRKLKRTIQNEIDSIKKEEIPTDLKMAEAHGIVRGLDRKQQNVLSQNYLKTYIDTTLEDTKKAFDAVMDDVAHDRFKSNSQEIEEKTRGMSSKEAKAYKAKFVRVSKEAVKDMNASIKFFRDKADKIKIPTADGQKKTMTEVAEEYKKIDVAQRQIIDDINQDKGIIDVAQGRNSERIATLYQAKKKIFGTPDNPKSKIERKFTPKNLMADVTVSR